MNDGDRRLFLAPGDYFFGAYDGAIMTLLGSCVAVTLWNPARSLVGVSHMVLARPGSRDTSMDTRYGEGVVKRLTLDICRAGLRPADFIFGLYGGSALLYPQAQAHTSVGFKNLSYMRAALWDSFGIATYGEDTGGCGHRRLTVDGRTGAVHVENLPMQKRGG